MPVFRQLGLSTVDDLQTPAGRLALAALLAGAQPGHYGLDQDERRGRPAAAVPSG